MKIDNKSAHVPWRLPTFDWLHGVLDRVRSAISASSPPLARASEPALARLPVASEARYARSLRRR